MAEDSTKAAGMDPMMAMMIAQIGSTLFSQLFGGGGGEDRQTFEGETRGGRSLDPRDLLAGGLSTLSDVGTAARNYAAQPVQLRSAYAQQPPSFTGGGLPMPIGVTGRDPALRDPSLLQLQGIQFGGGKPRDPYNLFDNRATTQKNQLGSGVPPVPSPQPDPADSSQVGGGAGTSLRREGKSLLGGGDADEALAALELLGVK